MPALWIVNKDGNRNCIFVTQFQIRIQQQIHHLTGVRQRIEFEIHNKHKNWFQYLKKRKKKKSFHFICIAFSIQHSVFILNVVSVFKTHTHSSRRMDCSHNTRDVLPFCSYCNCYSLVLLLLLLLEVLIQKHIDHPMYL